MIITKMTIEQNAIVIPVTFNDFETVAVVDTGDALGPTLCTADAEAAGVSATTPVGISGATGAGEVMQGTANVTVGDSTYENETVYVDPSLSVSLVGLPFFLAKAPAGVLLGFGIGALVGI